MDGFNDIDEESIIPCNISEEKYSSVPLIEQSFTDSPENSKCCTFLTFVKSLTIEPVVFLFFFAFLLNKTCMTNMIMDKGCLFHLKYPSEICQNLSEHREEKNNVEKLANNYNLYLTFLTPISTVIVIFLAPWSDKHGRKPPLIVALIGCFINAVGIILCTLFFSSRIEYIIISNLPSQFSGGFVCVLTMIYSHSSDVSSSQSRSLKYNTFSIAVGLALSLGALTGGQLYHYYGYLSVFLTAALSHLIALVWVVLFVQETQFLHPDSTCKMKLKDLCTTQNFREGLRACFKSRENNGRLRLWLLQFSSCTIAMTYEVYLNISYLYIHHKFNWDPSIFSTYYTMFSFFELVASIICGLLFIKLFKFSDPLIGLIGTLSMIGKNIFMAMANQYWFLYASNIFGLLDSFANVAIRSLISKLVDEDESGRVFSFLVVCETIAPLLGNSMTAKIFNATLETFPGMCYIAITLFLFIPLATFIFPPY